MKILVTGGAGFIGSNFVRRTLEDAYPGLEGADVVVYDALTYSGNLANLAPVADDPALLVRARRHPRQRRCSTTVLPGVDTVVHFAAESHVDRSVRDSGIFVETNVRRHPAPARREPARRHPALRARQHRRGVRLDRRGIVGRDTAARAELAVLGQQGGQRPARPQLPPHARHEPLDHALLEQLRAVPLPREGHPALRHQPDRRPARAALRRRATTSATGCTSTTTPAASRMVRRPAVAPARSTTSAAAPSSPTAS